MFFPSNSAFDHGWQTMDLSILSSPCVFVIHVTFNIISVISWQCLFVAGPARRSETRCRLAQKMYSHGGGAYTLPFFIWSENGPSSLAACVNCFSAVSQNLHCCQWLVASHTRVSWIGSPKAVRVLLCVCDNACKRSLAIFCKSRALCPVSRLLSVPIWPACAEQGHQYD